MNDIFKPVRPSTAQDYTGERMTAGHSLETEIEHFHRYYLARSLAAELDVLDISSGEGYGSAMLAQVARSVTGVDVDPATVAHAGRTYAHDTLRFTEGSATALPLPDGSVDLVVSFETLEHFDDHHAFFREARRVLRPGGRLVISTPDRDIYSPPGSDPNPFHVLELDRAEFAALIAAHFPHHAMLSQRAVVGSALLGAAPDGPAVVFDRRGPEEIAVSQGMPLARYLVAICADTPVRTPDSLFIETGDVHGLLTQVPWLKQEIADRIAIRERDQAGHAEALRAERASHQAQLDARLAAHHRDAAALSAAEANRAAAVERLENMERLAAQQTGELQRDVVRLQVELEAARQQARRLMGLWPRAELQRLRLDLAAEQAGRAAALAERDALSVVTRSPEWRFAMAVRHLANVQPRLAALLVRGARLLRLLRRGRLQARQALRRQRLADVETLSGHPLFDAAWYARTYLAGQPGTDPVAHYVWIGADGGNNPHPLFDTAWYRGRHAGLGLANPFADYLRRGMAADEDPHPLFDAAYYRAQAPEAGGRALEHFMRRDRSDGRCPVRFFDPVAYLTDNADLAGAGFDPVIHYVLAGAAEDRDPHPLFDSRWYRATHLGGDPAANPLAHWLRQGAAAGLSPHPLFPGLGLDDAVLTLPPAPAEPAASIVIPVYGRLMDTLRCLHAVAARSFSVPYEVIVADDRPSAPIAPALSFIPGLRTQVNAANMGFLRNCNAASRLARGRHLVFLNNDTVVGKDWLAPLVRLADADPSVGMVGCKLLNRDGTVQEAGGAMLDDGWGRPYGAGQDPALPQFNFVREVDVVIGAAFLVRRDAFEAVGGFDTRYAPAYYEEFDLAFALRHRGLKVMFQPASEVVHLDGSSYGKAERDAQSIRNHAKFCRKWQDALGRQPPRGTPEVLSRERPRRPVVLMMEDRVPQPDKNAGSVATAHYVSLLTGLGLRVVYFPHDSHAPQPYTARLEQAGVEVLHHPVTLPAWLRENGGIVDYVWATRPYVSGHMIAQLRRDTGAPILYLTHDMHFLREQRRFEIDRDPAALEEATRVGAIERAIFAQADRILSFSEDEAAEIRRIQPDACVTVLPLYVFDGAAGLAVQPRSFAGRRRLVFVGGFNHVPNVDAVLWLVKEIMPALWRTHPDATVTVVGPEPPEEVRALAGPRVEIAGFVADLDSIYAQARISINPLRFGAGVKGKIVSSLAAGLPVVTTTIGNEGIRLRDGEEVLLGDTADALAAHLATLLDDDARCQALAAAGTVVVATRFSRAVAQARVLEALGLPGPVPAA